MAVSPHIGRSECRRVERHSPAAQHEESGEGERRIFAPVASATSAVGNRQRVSVNYGNHMGNHIKEVVNDNNEHPGFAAIASRL